MLQLTSDTGIFLKRPCQYRNLTTAKSIVKKIIQTISDNANILRNSKFHINSAPYFVVLQINKLYCVHYEMSLKSRYWRIKAPQTSLITAELTSCIGLFTGMISSIENIRGFPSPQTYIRAGRVQQMIAWQYLSALQPRRQTAACSFHRH